jgi:hypothetical protein
MAPQPSAAPAPHANQVAQTFECRPTIPGLPNAALPDELMIDWGGIPAGAQASIYLPGTAANEILALAGRLYFGKPLTRVDDYTVRCNTTGLTYVPIPAGSVPGPNFAGLLTINLPHGLADGQRYTVAVRQLTTVDLVEAATVSATRRLRKIRKARGGFQLNVTIQSPKSLLIPAERSLAFFRWILSTRAPSDRWYPVLQRYVGELEVRVKTLGGNLENILPSPIGALPGEPQDVNNALEGREWTGKIEKLVYDRFGDFESFLLETDCGERIYFHSRESHIAELARFVWQDRIRVTVFSREQEPHVPERIVLHRPPSHELPH